VNFLHTIVDAGPEDLIEVTLAGNAANVMLLDGVNFMHYRMGRTFNYVGGHYTASPVVLRAPSRGQWNLVVDLGGRPGSVNASVRVLAGG
jgi:hypothetical protein